MFWRPTRHRKREQAGKKEKHNCNQEIKKSMKPKRKNQNAERGSKEQCCTAANAQQAQETRTARAAGGRGSRTYMYIYTYI